MKLISLATFIQSTRCHSGSGRLDWCAGVLSYRDSLLLFALRGLSGLRGCGSSDGYVDDAHGLSFLGDLGQLPTHIPSSFRSSGYQWKPFNGGFSPMEGVQTAAAQAAMNPTGFTQIIEEQFRQLRSGRYRLRPTPLT